MRLRKASEIGRVLAGRIPPCLHFVSFSLDELIRDVKKQCFPDLKYRINFSFVKYKHLACIMDKESEEVGEIFVHNILNQSDTPREVLGYIIKHELIHLIVPSREIKGRMRHHPPEFWDVEKELAPERDLAWLWIWENLWWCLKERPRLERTDVNSSWKEAWGTPRVYTFQDCVKLIEERKITEDITL